MQKQFTKKTLDMYMWEGPENRADSLENDGYAKDWITQETFDFYDNNQKVGRCGTEIQNHIKAFRGIHQFYPDSWFIGDTNKLKPILYVTLYNFEHFKRKGFGRAGLQKLYAYSKLHGCNGRIHLVATNGAGAFYEKCGFIGLYEAQDGLKYFDPIPERLDLLFSERKYFLFLKQTTKPETKIMPLERLKQQCRELFNQKERS